MNSLILAAALSSPGDPALAQFIQSVAAGLAVVVLAWIGRTLRTYAKQHDWLMRQTEANTEAIKRLLELGEARPKRR